MSQSPSILPTDEAASEVAQAVQGYTVSARGKCLARIGADYVMRDEARHCVRVPVEQANSVLLDLWLDFGHSGIEWDRTSMRHDMTKKRAVSSDLVPISRQSVVDSARDVCPTRVVGNYVTRDGLRHSIRLLVDALDPTVLGAAWAAFNKAAGWVGPSYVERADVPDRSRDQWHGVNGAVLGRSRAFE